MRCATGSRTSPPRTTCWAAAWVPTRTPPSSATSSGSSATRRPSSSGREGRLPDLVAACVGAARTPSACSPGSSASRRSAGRRGGGRGGDRHRQARGGPRRRHAGHPPRRPLAACSRTATARSSEAHSSRRGWTTRASGRSCRPSSRPVGWRSPAATDDEALAAIRAWPARRGHPARPRDGPRPLRPAAGAPRPDTGPGRAAPAPAAR